MPFGSGGTYAGSMAGSGSIGGNPRNSLFLLLQRLAAMRQGQAQQAAARDPSADAAMARMLGLPGAQTPPGQGAGAGSGAMQNMQLGWRPPGSAAGLTPQVLAKLQAGGGAFGARGPTMRQQGIGLGGY